MTQNFKFNLPVCCYQICLAPRSTRHLATAIRRNGDVCEKSKDYNIKSKTEVPVSTSGGFIAITTAELITMQIPDLLPECLPPQTLFVNILDMQFTLDPAPLGRLKNLHTLDLNFYDNTQNNLFRYHSTYTLPFSGL
jgi:hypothetical protein